ncbi:IclR family transcriptional regulator [Nocardioides sp. LHG3406-4]|uniref:IclR family transcriptional regulator n=1 Tax=Nocardioides sp. LHG3406-4 TaxID=2804575 RepID=UPI003CF47042
MRSSTSPGGGSAGLDDKSVLLRTAHLLDSFDAGHPVLPLCELVRRSDMPKSTVHRLAEQLVQLGWLERAPFGYRIGVRMFEMGGLADRYRVLRDRALPRLQELSTRTGLVVQLGVLDNLDVVYLERILVRGLNLPTREGGRMPAHCTGLGKVLLAFGSEAEVDVLLNAELPPLTPHTMHNPQDLVRQLRRVRELGYANDREEAVMGLECLAVPLRGSGRAIAAISVCGRRNQTSVDEHLAEIRRTASAIWADMFHQSGAATVGH